MWEGPYAPVFIKKESPYLISEIHIELSEAVANEISLLGTGSPRC